jgi:hypothetical protein
MHTCFRKEERETYGFGLGEVHELHSHNHIVVLDPSFVGRLFPVNRSTCMRKDKVCALCGWLFGISGAVCLGLGFFPVG